MQKRRVQHAIADVAAVSVAEEDVPDRALRRRDPPRVQPLAVPGLDRLLLAHRLRGGQELSLRDEQQGVEQRAPHPRAASQAATATALREERKRRRKSPRASDPAPRHAHA
jgi:hypothetical protein